MIILGIIVAIAIGLFWLILEQDIPGLWKFFLVFIEMLAVSQIFIKRYKLPSELGLVLIKSKRGIDLIDKISKSGKIFDFLSDVGNSIAYGLLSLVITRKNTTPVKLVLGLVILAVVSLLVAPTAWFLLSGLMGVGGADGDSVKSISNDSGLISLPVVLGLLFIGGLFLFILFGIVYYGAVVLSRVINYLAFGNTEILTTEPGGTFLLPGVNLPLFEGIIALTIVMIVHEGAHAILARIGKVPIESSGIVLFGIIPVGAFVEPDEQKLSKTDQVRQTRVLVAGATSNLLTSCLVFALFFAFAWTANGFGLGQNEAVMFVKTTLMLTFALNFIVGAVNLLPLPVFDGYRIIETNIKNKLVVRAIMYVALIFFALNFLPWFFHA